MTEKKSEFFALRLTPAERTEFEEISELEGEPPSSIARLLILRFCKKWRKKYGRLKNEIRNRKPIG